MDNVKIIENGVESEVASLAYLGINGKKYLFYSLNDFTENGLPKIRIAAANNQDNSISDEEWTSIKTVISSLANGIEVPNIEYIPVSGEGYNIGQVKKLAVKPELKQSFVDSIRNKLLSNQPTPTINTNPVNEQIPFYDQSIDINNTNDQLLDRTVVENAFDKSMVPPVPEAINQAVPSGIISDTEELTASNNVVVDMNSVIPNGVAPINQTVNIEPAIQTENAILNETKEDASMNNDMIQKLKEIVETNMTVIENSLKNIRDALTIIDEKKVVTEPVSTIPEPVIQSVAAIENPVVSAPVQDFVAPAPIEEQFVNPMPTAPIENPTIAPQPVESAFISQPMIDNSIIQPEPNIVSSPVLNDNIIMQNTEPAPNMMPSDIPVIPDSGVVTPAPTPISNEFAGMSPTNIPVGEFPVQ